MTVNERFQEKRIHRGRSRTALGRRNLGFPVNLQRKDKAREWGDCWERNLRVLRLDPQDVGIRPGAVQVSGVAPW